ncbi:MAG: hypothetical protein JO072_09785 [Parafilimonas sp.]|nr:hypothetical protein [Parafilimonas sp.]
MKKTLPVLAVLCLLLTQKSNAQIQRGNILVGGDLADFNLGLNKNSNFILTIDPTAAWFIRNNIAVGAYIILGVDAVKGATTTTYGVGPLARYYFGAGQVNTESVLRHTRLFAEGNVGIEGSNTSHGSSTNGLGIGIGPGIAYFITPNIGLEALLKYRGIVGFGNDPLNSRLDLNFGFQIYLPGRATAGKVRTDAR